MAVDAGISPERFWDLSIAEVNDLLESRARSREREFKEQLSVADYAVQELSRRIASMLPGGEEIPVRHVWDYYPSLYRKEKEAYEEYEKREELEQFKERRRQFAARYNRRWEAEHGPE